MIERPCTQISCPACIEADTCLDPAPPFEVVVADPPWPFKDKLQPTLGGHTRGAEHHYKLLNLLEIQNFLDTETYPTFGTSYIEIREDIPYRRLISDDCWLFLWMVESQQNEALSVVHAWGFRPYGSMIWNKKTVNGKPHMGMGHLTRAAHERVIIGHRGKPAVLSHAIRSTFDAPVGVHSQKPEAFFDLVEALAPGPYLELFARRKRPGWTCIGDEL